MSAARQPIRVICGMSRAGTTSMTRALNLRGDTAAFGESGFWGMIDGRLKDGMIEAATRDRLVEVYRATAMKPLRDGEGSLDAEAHALSQAIADAVQSVSLPARPGDVFRLIGETVAGFCGREQWVEKTPHNLRYLDDILAADPDARMVVMLRSPEGFMASYKHQGDRKQAEVRRQFSSLFHPAIAAMVCRGYLDGAARARAAHPQNVLVVRLEELKADTDKVLRRVMDHLGLPPVAEVAFPQSNSSFPQSKRAELEPADAIWLRLIAGSAAERIGYPRPQAPFAPMAFVASLAALAAWPVMNASRLLRYDGGPLLYLRRWLR